MTPAEREKMLVRKTALLAAALHIAKHMAVDKDIRQELAQMHSVTATDVQEELGRETVNRLFIDIQKEDPAFFAFITEAFACDHLNALFATDAVVEFFSQAVDPKVKVFVVDPESVTELQ